LRNAPLDVYAVEKSTDGEVANALVCKISIRGFDSRSVLQRFSNLASLESAG
jgi:hypothetical protein